MWKLKKITFGLDEVGEELGEAGEEGRGHQPAIQLKEEVGEGVGGGPVLVLIQNPHQQLASPDHHLAT